MITGAHVMLKSADADADRAFLRDVLGMRAVDAGGGWLVFAVPPTELSIHPQAANGPAEMALTTGDIDAFVAAMAGRDVATTAPAEEGWGRSVRVTLPGGAALMVYQPQHAHAH